MIFIEKFQRKGKKLIEIFENNMGICIRAKNYLAKN